MSAPLEAGLSAVQAMIASTLLRGSPLALNASDSIARGSLLRACLRTRRHGLRRGGSRYYPGHRHVQPGLRAVIDVLKQVGA